jgi:hypothetical protein
MSEREIETRALALPFQTDVWERGNLTHPWMNWPCVIYDAGTAEYWLGPNQGYSDDRADAHTWTPKEWFELGYRGNPQTWFYFIGQMPTAELPEAVQVFPTLALARDYAFTNSGRRFLVQGNHSSKWFTRRFLQGERGQQMAVDERKEAGVFSTDELFNTRFNEVDVRVELLPPTFIPPPAPQKIPIAQILSRNMIDSLERMPENEVIRTQVWSILKVPIPPEKKTYAEIKAWIEDNYNPKPSGSFRQSPPDGTPAMPVGGGPAASGFSMTCSYEADVSGSCRFRGTESGSTDYEVTGEMIREAAEEARAADDPKQEFLRRLATLLRENVADDPPETDIEEAVETEDYEVSHREGRIVRFNQAVLQGAALAWMQRHAPELAAEIFGELEGGEENDEGERERG